MNKNIIPTSQKPEAFFLPGVAGNLFAIYFPPDSRKSTGENVLVVPPFAEEMSRVRKMLSLQSRRLSSIGIGTLLIDLYGTGDSEGDFCDARWHDWISDVATGADWLKNNYGDRVSILGVRLGALLAMDFVQQCGDEGIEKTVFWNPVLKGEDNLLEFFRIRVLAGLMKKAMSRATIESLRAALSRGETVEVAGYELSDKLAGDIDRLQMGALGTGKAAPIHWIDIVAPRDGKLQSLEHDVIDGWNSRGILTKRYSLNGFPFWAKWDVRVVGELLELTTGIFKGK